MKTHTKKIIAPILITAFCLAWLGCWIAGAFFLLPDSGILPTLWVRLVLAAVPLALSGVSVFVLVERIREIKKGEEDDLSQY